MKVDSVASSTYFVYPFRFDSTNFDHHVQALGNIKWSGRKGLFYVWERQSFPEEDLLSHVARFLNPPPDIQATATSWGMSNVALQSINGGLGCGHSSLEWILLIPHSQISFLLTSIQVTLFRVGIGFLTINANPTNPDDQLNSWLDFTHYFRFSRGQRDVKLRINRRMRSEKDSTQHELVPFFPKPSGGLEKHPDGEGVLDDIISAALRTVGNQNELEPWWNDIFIPGQMLPYNILFVDEIPQDEIPITLYRFRNFFHACEKIHPSPEHLRTDHISLLPYAEQQWFVFSLDGGGFVAFNAPISGFYRSIAPDHLRKQYFLLFLLTLQQRFAFMMLLDKIAESWPVENTGCLSTINEIRENTFLDVRSQLLLFVARGYFAQAMQREHHHRCYRKWQEVFQVERLYQEISDEIHYMHDHLQNQRDQQLHHLENEKRLRDERLEKSLNMIAWLIGGPALALAFLEVTASTGDVISTSLAVAVGLLIGLLFIGILKKSFSNSKPKIKINPDS